MGVSKHWSPLEYGTGTWDWIIKLERGTRIWSWNSILAPEPMFVYKTTPGRACMAIVAGTDNRPKARWSVFNCEFNVEAGCF